MKNIKKIIGLCLVSSMLVISHAKVTFAAIETNLKRVEEKVNTIDISIDKFNYEAKSFQLELKLEGDVSLDTLTWNEALNDSNIKKTYKYDEKANTINIYVTSQSKLVKYSNLSVCTIKVKGELDTTYDIKSNGTFKFIYSDKNKEGEIVSLPSDSTDGFKYLAKANTPEEDNNNGGSGDVDSPDNGDNDDVPNTGNPDVDTPDNDVQEKPEGDDSSTGETPGSGNTNEEGTTKPNDTNNSISSSNPIKTGDIIGGVLATASASTIGMYLFRPRGKHCKKRGKRFKK